MPRICVFRYVITDGLCCSFLISQTPNETLPCLRLPFSRTALGSVCGACSLRVTRQAQSFRLLLVNVCLDQLWVPAVSYNSQQHLTSLNFHWSKNICMTPGTRFIFEFSYSCYLAPSKQTYHLNPWLLIFFWSSTPLRIYATSNQKKKKAQTHKLHFQRGGRL
jgi:hypothetical protein